MQKSLQHLEELTIAISLYEDNTLMKRLKVDSEKAHTLFMGYLQAVICLLRHSQNKHTQEAEAERTLNYSTIGKIVLKIKLKLKITQKIPSIGMYVKLVVTLLISEILPEKALKENP